MAALANTCVAILVLSLLGKGYCIDCSLNDIHVAGAKTGKVVGGKPEWMVTVSNGCKCRQFNIKLACDGFQTTEPVDEDILNTTQGGACMFIKGAPLEQSSPVTFYYAWDTPFTLIPAASEIDPC